MGELTLSIDQNCAVIVGLLKVQDITKDGQDDLLASIKLLCSTIKSVIALRLEGSNRDKLPDLFVMRMLKALQTSNVEVFTIRMKQFALNVVFKQFETGNSGDTFYTPRVTEAMYTYATSGHLKYSAFVLGKTHCYPCPSQPSSPETTKAEIVSKWVAISGKFPYKSTK